MKWQDFEIQATNHLKTKFSQYAQFSHEGSSDSTISDIKVITNKGNYFHIEAKQSPAQSGQFVLIADIISKEFIFSKRNKSNENENTEAIRSFMNQHFNSFKESGTTGKDIVMPNDTNIFTNWIINYYQSKGVRYFISNDFLIIPIECLAEYFNVSAKYRIKKSGSSHVGKSNSNEIASFVEDIYNAETVIRENSKVFIQSQDNLHNNKFEYNGNEFMISSRGAEEYEVRRLSNTFNANVIFSIELKSDKSGMSDSEFIAALTD